MHESQQELDDVFIECLGSHKISPGDTVIIRKKMMLSEKRMEILSENIKIASKQYQCKFLILENDIDIEIKKAG